MTDEDKDARIKELEALVASLRQQLKTAKDTIARLQHQNTRRWRDEADYLPYEDRDR